MVLGQPMDVVILGLSRDPEQVARNLGHLFGIDLAQARGIVRSVPCVAKREISEDDARRYVRALAASGCKAETRPSAAASQRPAARSLPAPRVSGLPELDAEERAAVDRWRRAEGLEPLVSGPPRSSRELAHSVPRAPRLPGDLGPASGGALGLDGRPAWLTDDPGEVNLDSSNPPGASPFSPHKHNLSSRPGAVGVARTSQPSAATTRDTARLKAWQRRVLLLVTLCVLAGVLAWRFVGAEDRALRERWAGAGIVDTVPHMPYADWIDGANNRLVGAQLERGIALIDALRRSGVKNLWVVGYREHGEGNTASRLAFELPGDEESRRMALWHLSRFHEADPASIGSKALRYVEVDLQ